MSVKRRELIQYLEENGYWLLREGGQHSIYTDGATAVPVKRHKDLDRIAVKVETSPDRVKEQPLLQQVREDLQAVLGISADVELVEFGVLPRSEVGKARRVIDLRPKP